MDRINPITRAVIIKDNHVLLAQDITLKNKFYFLPGGHVEYLEPAEKTLSRELEEEIDIAHAKVKELLGVLECSWDNKGTPYHEMNLIFRADISNVSVDKAPNAKVKHLAFSWHNLNELENIEILPEKVKKIIVDSFENKRRTQIFSSLMKFTKSYENTI